ncbi:hypothetical protein KY284_036277 [Solanum tuberosum]|nr:hypothetical protein KY284_036277 [Solanum tuberosum]
MNITLALPQSVNVVDPHGRVFTQKVQYYLVPKYCGTCLQLGHSCKQLKPAAGEANEPPKPSHMAIRGRHTSQYTRGAMAECERQV